VPISLSTDRAVYDPAVLKNLRKNPVIDLIVTLAMAIAIAYVVQLWLVKPFQVPSESMVPRFEKGDHIIAARFLYHLTDPARGAILVFHPNGQGNDVFENTDGGVAEPYYVKRLIGLPGEIVGSHDGKVYVCASRSPTDPQAPTKTTGCRYLDEPYVHGQRTTAFGLPDTDYGPVVIPAGQYLMLGDNRENSDDGRHWGTIRRSQIVGRAFMTYWPLNRISIY
jgi:signal peptidase I